jgi:hypothetical protein
MPKYKWNTLCHFHGKKGYVNAPESYVTHTIPTLFTLALEGAEILLYAQKVVPAPYHAYVHGTTALDGNE